MWFARFFFAIRFLRSRTFDLLDSLDSRNGRRKDDLRCDQVSEDEHPRADVASRSLLVIDPFACMSRAQSWSCLHIAEGNIQEHAQHISTLKI